MTDDSARTTPTRPTIRRDGWTPERQRAFLAGLVQTRSVTRAAAHAGMSRKSAYRLRARPAAALFAHLWDRALRTAPHGTNAKVTKATPDTARSALESLLGQLRSKGRVTKRTKRTTPRFTPFSG